jgi:hypothetical protein
MNSGENKLHSKRGCGPKYVTSDFGVRLWAHIVLTWFTTQQILPSAAEECKTSERSGIKRCEIWGLWGFRSTGMWCCEWSEATRLMTCSYHSRPESSVLNCCRLGCFYLFVCWLVTKCTQAWSFLQHFSVVHSNNVTNFCICSWHRIIIMHSVCCISVCCIFFSSTSSLSFFFNPYQFNLFNSQGQKNGLEMLPTLILGVHGPLYQDESNNTQQLLGTFIIQTHFIHISVANCILLFSKIVGFHFIQLHEEWKIGIK